MNVTVTKAGGKRPSEAFDQNKLRRSIRAACLSVRSPEGEAETTANSVCSAVERWLTEKPEVTSGDLRRKAGDILEKHHPEAGYLYKHHRLVM